MSEFVSAEIRGRCDDTVKVSLPVDGTVAVEVRDYASSRVADVHLDRESALTLISALRAAIATLPSGITINMSPSGYYETAGPVRHVGLGGDASISQSVRHVREVR